MSVLRADEPASIANLTRELTACGPQALEPFQTGIISLSVYFISLFPLPDIKKTLKVTRQDIFLSVCPAQAVGSRRNSQAS